MPRRLFGRGGGGSSGRNNNNNNNNQHAATNTNNTTTDSATFLQQAQTLIPAEVRMISGCEDEQTSADVFCGTTGGLPNPRGRAGGACTSALLEILHQNSAAHAQHDGSANNNNNNNNKNGATATFQQVLMQLRDKLSRQGHSQIPQLTSSRPLDLDETPFRLIGSEGGARRALLVGINYQGQSGELRGCHNDVYHMQDYLIKVHGFPPRDVLVLLDDNQHHVPNREKIIRALRHLVAVSQPGDAVFFHYSGHGGLLEPDFNSFKTTNKDYDQTLIPVDHNRSGQIRDFSLFHHFVQPMKPGVVVTCLMDCCHSGSVLDLPYSYKPTNTGRGSYAMQENLSMLSNLAFLYMLAGGVFPHGGLFDNVTNHLQDAIGGDLTEYQGMLGDTLTQDMMDADAYGDAGDAAADAMDGMGDVVGGDYGGDGGSDDVGDAINDTVGDGDFGDYGDNEVSGEDVTREFGGGGGGDDMGDFGAGGGGFGDAAAGFGGGGGDYDTGDDGYGGGGFNFADAAADDVAGDEGCGDEGCGDLLSTLADCLNDA